MTLIGRTITNRITWRAVVGFTLIELAIALVVLGLLAMLAVQLLPNLTDRIRLDQTKVDETTVNKAVVGFALAHNRLPCPDTNNNGQEGGASGTCAAGDVVGTLPYRSMGLPGPALDEARLPLRYGVYRDSDHHADLASLNELFEPALPDRLTITAGTAAQCNQMSDASTTTVTYYSPPATTVTVHVNSGTFKKNDLIGYVHIAYNDLQTATPPTSYDVDSSCPYNQFVVCPCGGYSLTSPPYGVCNTCTGFHAGNSVTSDLGADIPFLNDLKSNYSSSQGTLIGFPGYGAATTVGTYTTPGFSASDPLYELYVPAASQYYGPDASNAYGYHTSSTDYPCRPTRTITLPNSSTTTTNALETGVSAQVDPTVTTPVESNQALIAADPIDLGGGDYKLPISQFTADSNGDPTNPFAVGDTIYSSSGGVGTVVAPGEVTQHLTFNNGDLVYAYSQGDTSNPPSGTGTISNVNGNSFQWNAISGTISAGSSISQDTISSDFLTNPPTAPTKPDAIVDQNTGAIGTVASVTTGPVLLPPTVTHGSISFTATTSHYTNELDFCQAIRNAIAATESPPDFHSLNGVYTVNQDQSGILVNPAYLLVSGGVEDANGNGNGLSDFDLRNELSPSKLDFESPGRLRNSSPNAALAYDDVVSTMQMKVLAERLRCARNIGAVNALAADATVERNLEEMAFEQNEQALTNVQLTYAALQLAKLDVAIKTIELFTSFIEGGISLYKSLNEDPTEWYIALAAAAEVVNAIASIVLAVPELAVSVDALSSAQNDYEGACSNQQAKASALNDAINAANTALGLAVRADAWGGVQ